MFNATFFIISVLLEEETGLPEKKKHWLVLSHFLLGEWRDPGMMLLLNYFVSFRKYINWALKQRRAENVVNSHLHHHIYS